MSDDKLDAVFGLQQLAAWRQPPKTTPSEDRKWDSHPLSITVRGVEREFFPIGALAAALGRKTVTIRAWESKRILPGPRYRRPPPVKAPLRDKTAAGRRLYSRQQIDAVVAAARATGVYDPANAANANWEEFTRLVRAAWAEL